MSDYNLQINEGIIYTCSLAYYNKGSGELIVTDLNLIFNGVRSAGIFTNEKVTLKFPLNLIKVVNNRAQIIVKGVGNTELEIHFMNSIEKFNFNNGKEAKKMANYINGILTNGDVLYDSKDDHIGRIVGAGKDLASGVFGTIGIFGDKVNEPNENLLSKGNKQSQVGKCKSCGAPIQGKIGEIVYCEYCDSAQHI